MSIAHSPRQAAAPDPRRWRALALLALADFVVILDATIVNIALPSMGRHFHASIIELSWVVSAYVLAFGGLLMLGGRLADLRQAEAVRSRAGHLLARLTRRRAVRLNRRADRLPGVAGPRRRGPRPGGPVDRPAPVRGGR